MDQNRKKRKRSKLLFLLNVILEACAIGAVMYCTLFSYCVLGNEVAGPVYIFLFFIFSAFIPDLFYFALSRKLHTLGIDPLGVMFNFVMGILCILIGISLILVMLAFCGNYAQFILVGAGAFGICSGVFHLMNAFMCHKILPKSERYYRHPRQRKGAKGQKVDKKAKKADKKGHQKSAKKGDKKDDKKGDKKAHKKGDRKGDKKGGKKDADKKDADKKDADKKDAGKKDADKKKADKKALKKSSSTGKSAKKAGK